MIGTSISPTALPKAGALTTALLEASTTPVAAEDLVGIRRLVQQELTTITSGSSPRTRIRIDGYRLRRSVTANAEPERQFEWNPWTTRRILGLKVVRTCVAHPRLFPAQTVPDTVARLIARVGEPGHEDSLARWLHQLPLGARAVVEAEAVQWSTQLLSALDWSQIPHPHVGSDRSLLPLDSSSVVLRGRVDVEVRTIAPLRGGEDGANPNVGSALFLMMAGQPYASARIELGLPALTIALDERRHAVPTTVIGWWPQSGRALVLPVNVDLLLRTFEAVSEVVRRALPKRLQQINRRNRSRTQIESTSSLERAAS